MLTRDSFLNKVLSLVFAALLAISLVPSPAFASAEAGAGAAVSEQGEPAADSGDAQEGHASAEESATGEGSSSEVSDEGEAADDAADDGSGIEPSDPADDAGDVSGSDDAAGDTSEGEYANDASDEDASSLPEAPVDENGEQSEKEQAENSVEEAVAYGLELFSEAAARAVHDPDNPNVPVKVGQYAPGTYTVRVTADGEEIQQTVTVKEDMVLRLTPGQNSSAGYGDIVSQYEEKYGELQFYEQTYGTNYTGVFLLRLVDFDQDGTDELVIGYAVPYPQGIEYCAWPALDVWTMENGTPVCVYEGAYVQQSDIGRHCLYTEWNGNFYLVTGWSGSNVELNLLKLENGTFVTDTTLKSAEIMSGAYVTGMEYYLNDEAVDENAFNSYHEQIYASGSFGGSLYEGDSTTLEDLSAQLQEMKKQMGIG